VTMIDKIFVNKNCQDLLQITPHAKKVNKFQRVINVTFSVGSV